MTHESKENLPKEVHITLMKYRESCLECMQDYSEFWGNSYPRLLCIKASNGQQQQEDPLSFAFGFIYV